MRDELSVLNLGIQRA